MKTFRKIAALLITAALVFTVAFANRSFHGSTVVAGTTTTYESDFTFDNNTTTAAVQRKAKLGDDVSVPAGSTVTDPQGRNVDVISGKFEATQAGYYTVKVEDSAKGNVYDGFKVLVEAYDATIKIPFDGATIPTYLKSGETIKLPKAEAVVMDENGIIDEEKTNLLPYEIIEVRISDSSGTISTLTKKDNPTELETYTYETDGATARSYLIRYSAIYKSEAGKAIAVITKDFTVKTQKDFNPTGRPQLNLTNVPNTANVNSKLTLPKATATDSWDSNIQIEIQVKDPDGNKVLEVNDDNPEEIFVPEGAKEVTFDNNGNRSFYPMTKTGPYTVLYIATNDQGEKAESSNTITVSDNAPPTIVVEEEDKIPSVWGTSVYRAYRDADDDKPNTAAEVDKGKMLVGNEAKLYIPIARAWDNIKLEGDNQKVHISIKDPKGNIFFDTNDSTKSVVENIASISENKDEDGNILNYYFDINSYSISSGDDTAGTYVIYYKARDAKNLESTKSYSVEIKSGEHKDLIAPVISVRNINDLVWVDEKFTKPAIEVTDPDNSRIKSEEEFKFKGVSFETLNKDFEEVPNIAEKDSLKFMLDRDGFVELKKEGEITISLEATDQVGNKSTKITEAVQVVLDSLQDPPQYPTITGKLHLLKDSSEQEYYKKYDKIKLLEEDNDTDLIRITAAANKANKFIGYEVIILDSNNKSVYTKVTSTYREGSNNEKAELTIHQIEFEPTSGGEYTITVRGTDLYGASTFASTKMFIHSDNSVIPSPGANRTAATINNTIPKSMEVGQTTSLPKWESTGEIGDIEYELVRYVHGARYELKGNLFTPYETGSIYFEAYNRDIANGTKGSVESENITVTDSVNPEIKVLSDFEIYKAKFDADLYKSAIDDAGTNTAKLKAAVEKYMVRIPEVSVINLSGIVTVNVTVKDKDSTPVSSLESKFEYNIDDTTKGTFEVDEGARFFRPTKDGIYTIEYTATSVNGNEAKKELTISVGDLVAPTITVKTSAPTTLTQGSTFSFSELTISDTVSELYYITVTRQLIGPDGTTVHSESGYAATTKTYTLETAGTYKVRYEAKDQAGNVAIVEEVINVTSKASSKLSTQVIATIIFIAAAVLFLAVVIYIMGFRKVSADKLKTKQSSKQAD